MSDAKNVESWVVDDDMGGVMGLSPVSPVSSRDNYALPIYSRILRCYCSKCARHLETWFINNAIPIDERQRLTPQTANKTNRPTE
jgi:hypothetical protein